MQRTKKMRNKIFVIRNHLRLYDKEMLVWSRDHVVPLKPVPLALSFIAPLFMASVNSDAGKASGLRIERSQAKLLSYQASGLTIKYRAFIK